MNHFELDIAKANTLLRKKEISAVELFQSVLTHAQEVEPKVHAYLSILEKEGLKQAEIADERLKKNAEVTPLTGIPMGIKDNICIEGYPATCGSKILENFHPPYDATVIQRLKNAGVVFVGKTNCDEFAMGSSTENSAFGVTRNPWDLERVPGGSSGGSAAAVAAFEALAALGSDTGGSVRQPASFCGVVGLKPTYGLVSRYGLVAFASSLDQIGPLTHTVSDCAEVFQCIGGYDEKDSTSAKVQLSELRDYDRFKKDSQDSLNGFVVGIPQEFLGKGIDPEVKAAVLESAKNFEAMGAKLEEVHLPTLEYALSAYYLIASSEASSNLARYDGTRYGLRVKGKTTKEMFSATRKAGFGLEVKRRIMLGTYALSAGYYDAFYLKAQKVRTLIKEDFDKAFQKCTILLTPTCPTPAFKLGEKIDDPLSMYLSDVYTIPVNLVGIPGLSIPAGFSSKNLPIGIQLLAPHFHDFTLLYAGKKLEENFGSKTKLALSSKLSGLK